MHIIGDVKGKSCLIVDDMVDTAGTLCKAADALKDHGATKVVAYCTHPVLSGPAIQNIEESNLDSLVVTDTIPLNELGKNCKRIRQLSMAKLLAESIRRVSNEESISAMFDNTWVDKHRRIKQAVPSRHGSKLTLCLVGRRLNKVE